MNINQSSISKFDQKAQIHLCSSRAHEVYGSGKFGFAAYICSLEKGTVIWIGEKGQRERVYPNGLREFCDPGRFIFAYGKDHRDVLWLAEEALRSGGAPIIVVQIQKQIDLTAGRRLQLAAEVGKSLGLFLIPKNMGSGAAQTRWACSSLWDENNSGNRDSTLFDWHCIKNKSGTITRWTVCWNGAAYHINMAKQVAKSASIKAVNG